MRTLLKLEAKDDSYRVDEKPEGVAYQAQVEANVKDVRIRSESLWAGENEGLMG